MAIVAVVCSASMSAARAQQPKRVAMLSVSGPQGPRARAIISSAIANHAQVVPDGEVDRARQESGGQVASDEDVVDLATRVSADAVVEGNIRREHRRWVLVVGVRSGDTGLVLGRAVFPMRNLGGLGGIGGAVWGRISEYIAEAHRPDGAGQPAVPAAVAATNTSPGADPATLGWTPSPDISQPAAAPQNELLAMSGSATTATPSEPLPPDSSLAETVEPTSEPETSEEPAETATSTAALFEVQGDLSFINRDYSLPVGAEPDPRRYGGGGPEVGLALRGYYLAMGGVRSAISGFHLYALARRHLSLETQGESVTGAKASAETGESQLEIGLAFPFRFGETSGNASLGPWFAYGAFEFSLDAGDMEAFEEHSRLTTVDYSYLAAGAELGVPLYAPYLSARLSGGYRSVLGVGEAASEAFGNDTGGGSGLVLGGGIGGDLPFVVPGLYWLVRAEYFTFSTQFDGDGTMGDGDIGEDAYFRAGAAVGFRLEG